MEVKKEGINLSTWTMDVICPNCKAGFSIEYKDMEIVTTIKKRIFYKKWGQHFAVRCFGCKKKSFIKSADIPLNIKKAIIAKSGTLEMFLNFYT